MGRAGLLPAALPWCPGTFWPRLLVSGGGRGAPSPCRWRLSSGDCRGRDQGHSSSRASPVLRSWPRLKPHFQRTCDLPHPEATPGRVPSLPSSRRRCRRARAPGLRIHSRHVVAPVTCHWPDRHCPSPGEGKGSRGRFTPAVMHLGENRLSSHENQVVSQSWRRGPGRLRVVSFPVAELRFLRRSCGAWGRTLLRIQILTPARCSVSP